MALSDNTRLEDPWMAHALDVIRKNYSTDASAVAKGKDLLKFGANKLVGTTAASLQIQPAGILHESYVSSNLINSIVSTDSGDTEVVGVEGHTSSDGLTFAFSTQDITLTGQTAVALTTPLARVTRVYNKAGTELAGTVSVTETDTYSSGVPDTASKVHLQISAGEQNSDKAATTLSSTDYWIVTGFSGSVLEKTSVSAEVDLQVRCAGEVFRVVARVSTSNAHNAVYNFLPYRVIQPNSDIRLVAVASGANTEVSGTIQGVLATTAT